MSLHRGPPVTTDARGAGLPSSPTVQEDVVSRLGACIDRLELVVSVDQALLESRSRLDLSEAVAAALVGPCFDAAAVFAVHPVTRALELSALRGLADGERPSDLRVVLGATIAGEAAYRGQTVQMAEAGGEARRPSVVSRRAFASEIAVPVTIRGRVVAVVSGLATRPDPGNDRCVALEVVARRMAKAWDRLDQQDAMRAKVEELEAVLYATSEDLSSRLAEATEKVAAEADGRLAVLDQLRHAERLATVGKLASGIAHELGTPLNVVGARASMIGSGELAGPEIAESTKIIVEQVERMAAMVRQLLDFARSRVIRRAPAELAVLLHKTLNLLRPVADKAHIQISLAGEDHPVKLAIDSTKIQQVFINLVMNAIQATPPGGAVEVETTLERRTPPAGLGGAGPTDVIVVAVRDSGTGIVPEHLPRLFEPFFTTKGAGEGTGLGLPVSDGIVREHGGWIDVSSELGRGSCFAVCLPRMLEVG